ncbi:MAG: Ig-like domain-containing protein [Mangrovibacterium sp.]|nr:Ig-like domain-containing protein [Mangrovibacterium sp.]
MKIRYSLLACFWIILAALTACEEEEKAMTGIAVNMKNVTMNVDVITEVIAFPIPWDAEVLEKFTWTSENTAVAKVNKKGQILGVDPGQTNVICHYGNLSAPVQVTVNSVEALGQKINALQAKGYWEFEDGANLTKKTIGNDLIFVEDNKQITSVEGPRFDNKAIRIPRDPKNAGVTGTFVQCNHGFLPKGGEGKVNEYTVMWDIRLPNEPGMPESSYYSLMSSRTLDNSQDQDLAIKRAGNIGLGGIGYSGNGTVTPGKWYRVVLAVKAGSSVTIYVNGSKVHDGSIASAPVDGRHSLLPEGVLFFSDEDGDDSTIDASAVAIWDRQLTAAEVKTLGSVRQAVAFEE